MSERNQSGATSEEIAPAGDDAPGTADGQVEPTVGTGSFFAIGCVILLVIAVIVLGAIFFRP